MTEPPVVVRPSRELISLAVSTFGVYAMLRPAVGREQAFQGWAEAMGLSGPELLSISRVRVWLIQEIGKGALTYDDIDWSGQDEDRRASSTGTVFVDSLEAWLAEA